MAKRAKASRFTTPLVTLIKWPSLTKPDFGNKDYPDPDGRYKTSIMASHEDMQGIINQIQPLYDEALENARREFDSLAVKTRKAFEAKGITGPVPNAFWAPIYDEETEEETGDIEMKLVKRYSGERKNPKPGQSKRWTSFPPKIFDAQGNQIDLSKKDLTIYSGTKAFVTIEVKLGKDDVPGYFIPGTAACGITLIPAAIQIVDLVSAGGASAEDYGFGAVDGGFSAATLGDRSDDDEVDQDDVNHEVGDDNDDF